jgi:hypothetical protein
MTFRQTQHAVRIWDTRAIWVRKVAFKLCSFYYHNNSLFGKLPDMIPRTLNPNLKILRHEPHPCHLTL